MEIFPDIEELSHAAARLVVRCTSESIDERGSCGLVLAGGSTPKRLYELLATTYRERIPWKDISVFWGDERFVPQEHPASNYSMAEAALLRHVPLSSSRIHPIPTGGDPSSAAGQYEDLLDAYRKQRPDGPLFDVVLLGLGDDGHTASIFPSTLEQVTDPSRSVIKVEAPPEYSPRARISMTLNTLNDTEHAIFLITGATKQKALNQVENIKNPKLPASHITAKKAVHWLVDEEAAG